MERTLIENFLLAESSDNGLFDSKESKREREKNSQTMIRLNGLFFVCMYRTPGFS